MVEGLNSIQACRNRPSVATTAWSSLSKIIAFSSMAIPSPRIRTPCTTRTPCSEIWLSAKSTSTCLLTLHEYQVVEYEHDDALPCRALTGRGYRVHGPAAEALEDVEPTPYSESSFQCFTMDAMVPTTKRRLPTAVPASPYEGILPAFFVCPLWCCSVCCGCSSRSYVANWGGDGAVVELQQSTRAWLQCAT